MRLENSITKKTNINENPNESNLARTQNKRKPILDATCVLVDIVYSIRSWAVERSSLETGTYH